MKSHPRFLLSAGVVAAALICCAPSPLQAVDKFWIASGGGTFGTAANWSLSDGGVVGGGVPVAADVANFTLNNTYTVNFGAGVTNTNLDVDNGDVTFNLNRNTYTLTGSSGIDIGLIAPQTGRLTLRNGALAVDTNGDKVEIGGQLSSGFLTVTTGASLGTAALRPAIAVGRQSMGTLTVSDNGRVDASELIAGILSFGTGTVTIAGPTAVMDVSGTMTLGDGGKVTLDVTSGGTLTSGGTVTLANALGSDSVATISGANSRWNLSSGQTIGSAGRGVMTISGGGQVVSSSAVVGSNAGSEGRITVSGAGSQWTVGGALTVGNSGRGELTVSAGGEVSATSMTLASALFANGVATVTGAGSKLATSGSVLVGNGTAAGTLSVASSAEVYVGANLTVTDRLNLDGGSIFVAGNLTNNNFVNFTDGLLQVKGNFQAASGPLQLTINGADNDDIPTLDLIGAGLTTNVAGITIGNNRRGRLLLRQGRSITSGGNDFAIGAAAGGEGFVSVQSGALLGVGVAGALVVGGVGTTPGGTGTLDISGGTVSVLALRLFRDGTINLSGGGLLAVDSILALDGQFNWTNGTLRLTAPFTLSGANVPKLLGSDATLRAGQVLASNPAVAVTLQTPLVVDGGSLSGSTLVNQSRLEVRSGVVGTVQNNGLIVGDGTIDGAVTNGAAGTIRVDAGDAIFFTGSVAPNAGELNLQGGTLDFTSAVTNSATGRINGRGTLDFNGGLTNAGKMQFSGGPTDIFGNVTFTGGTGGGEMINSGGGNVVTFYDNVTHNGDEIRTSPTNTTVFFGNFTGAGPFTGTGAVRFEGTFSPGNSPGQVAMDGDVELSAGAQLLMELSGVRDDQRDQLQVGGGLLLGGSLEVTLLDGFAPRYGDAFDLFDFGTLAGRFDALNLPALGAGLVWDTSALYSTGAITAVPEPAGWIMLLGGIMLTAACPIARRHSTRFA